MSKWTPIRHGVPEDGAEVEVISPSGDQRRLVYDRGLWWLPDRSMYVYFIPAYWRLSEGSRT